MWLTRAVKLKNTLLYMFALLWIKDLPLAAGVNLFDTSHSVATSQQTNCRRQQRVHYLTQTPALPPINRLTKNEQTPPRHESSFDSSMER